MEFWESGPRKKEGGWLQPPMRIASSSSHPLPCLFAKLTLAARTGHPLNHTFVSGANFSPGCVSYGKNMNQKTMDYSSQEGVPRWLAPALHGHAGDKKIQAILEDILSGILRDVSAGGDPGLDC